MIDYLDIPRNAISAFEQATDLRVTVHDLEHSLWQFMLPQRWAHSHPLCRAIKNSREEAKCLDFEVDRLRREICDFPEGRYHICHAGFVEWVVPVFDNRKIIWIFFAGLRTFDQIPDTATIDFRYESEPTILPDKSGVPSSVDKDEAEIILEQLRQLVARLKQWKADYSAIITDSAGRQISLHETSRKIRIQRFIQTNYMKSLTIADLAAHINLSESRTIHLVRELFGKTFVQLLNDVRIQGACSLLRHSEMAIPEISLRNGFNDLSHFHRVFKTISGTTPHRYRKHSRF